MALDLDQIFANAPLVEDPPKKQPWELAFEKHFNVQPTSAPVASQPSKAQLLLQPYLDKGLDVNMALEANKHARDNQVNTAVNMGMDMVNHNPIGALTMDPDKFRKRVKDSGTAFGTDDIVDEAEAEIRKTVPLKMGEDWFKREYDIKDGAISIASDVHDEIGEQLTKDAYDYSNKFLSDTDRQMATINQQIKAEKEKTTEDGYDAGKVKSLYLQLSALGKTYTDENGDVIDPAKATPEQKEYMKTVDDNVIELTKLKETEGGGKRLKDAYFEQYKFVRALDELYDSDVDPWLQTQIKAQAGPSGLAPAVAVMPRGMKQIVEQRRDATAKLAALSKLYLANTSPANVKKDFKYSIQSTAKGVASGLLGKAMTSALQDELGPTERDMLDAAQSIMYSKGLDVPEDIQKKFDRSIGEYANEGGSQMLGMLPLLGVAGGATNALKVASGLEKLIVGWKKGGDIAKVGATMAEMVVEEFKLAGVGFAPGTGSGFVLSGKALPNLSLRNPWANGILQFMVKPAIITSSMYGARVTESMVESAFSYKDFNDILSEKFGDKKELIGTALSNFMFGFGNKSVAPDKYKEMLDHAAELRKTGKEKDAIWLEQQVGAYKKMDKASGIAYRKGKFEGLTEDQIYEKMKAAESEAAGKAAASTQVTLEQQNLLERTVPPERLSIVMKGSKMRDAEGNLQVYYHGTDAVFNRFSKVGNKKATGGRANSRSERGTYFSTDPEMAKSFGTNVERRYLNFKNPKEVGNIRGLNDAKIAQAEKDGFDGITGWETKDGVKKPVAVAFGTQGIIKAEELLPFRSKNAETLRSWADQLRNKELKITDVLQGGAPLGMAKFEKAGLEAMAKTLEIAGDVVEAVAKGIAAIQETGRYKNLTPEDRAKFDPEIKARLQKLLEESKPEAVAKYDLEKANKMQSEATSKYLPDFTKEGEAVAEKLGGKFTPDVKTAENIVSKKKRAGLEDVLDVPDVVRGTLVVSDMKEFKKAAKAYKDLGYSIHNQRNPNSETGYRGVTATKRNGELGTEIQIHTQETLDAQRKAEDLTRPYRDMGKPKVEERAKWINRGTSFGKDNEFTAKDGSTYKLVEAGGENAGDVRVEVYATGEEKPVGLADFKKNSDGTFSANKEAAVTVADKFSNKGIANAMYDYVSSKHGDIVKSTSLSKEGIRLWNANQSTPYKNAITESKQLYDEAYSGLEDINLEGSPAKTPLEKKMKAMEIPIATQKELNKAWTEQKQKLMDEVKAANSLTPESKQPKKLYRGSDKVGDHLVNDITWFAEDKNTAKGFGKNITEESVDLGRSFNSSNTKDIQKLLDAGFKLVDKYSGEELSAKDAASHSDTWDYIENSKGVLEWLKKNYDSVEITEGGSDINYIVFDAKNRVGAVRNESVKDQFKQFVKDMPLTGLGVPLRKVMLNKVNSIDFTKPKSLEKAITYFDKVINDATFRLNAVEYFKGLTTLDQKTSDLDVKVNGILKAKAGPDYLPTREHLEGIRKNMLDGDYNKAQAEIEAIYDKYRTDNGINEISPEDLQRIEDLSFHGLLNATNQASLPELKGAVRSLKDIIKLGKAEAAARRYIRKSQEAEFRQNVFNILNGKPGKPVEMDPRKAVNLKTSAYTDAARKFDWVQLDSFFTLLDKLSKFDKESDPYQSILNKELGGSVLQADLDTYKESHELYNMIQDKAKEVFGSKKNWQLRRDSHARTKKLHYIEFDEMGTFKSMEITENQAYKKYMEFQDPSLEKANEAGGYMKDGQLTELGQKIQDVMSPATKEWADWQLNEFYPMMYEKINPKYKELYGRDMPMGEKYSPIFVEGKGKDMAENDILAQQHLLNTATNASLKTRVAHANPLRLMDGDKVLLNYVDKMIYFKNWSDAINLLNGTFIKDPNIKTAIQQNFGDIYNKVAQNFIDEFARQPRNLNTYIQAFEKIRNNFAISSLAIKPTVFFAQITAIPAYLEKVPTLAYANEFRKFITDPKGSWDILQELRKDSFWQQRYGEGWDRDVIAAMREDLHSIGGSTWQQWKNQTMFLTKYGDMAAVVVGGLPMYRHVYNESIKKYGPGSERQAKAEAMAAFAQATRESQQAGQSYDLSVMQRANSFTKLLTMYKTSPFQYHRKVVGAVRNMSHGRGDVSGNLKTIAIYHVILPQIFQIVGNGFRWDKDDQIRALGFGNINEIFVAGDIMKGITNTIQGLPFDYQMTPVESTWKSAQKGTKHLMNANIKAVFDAAEEVNMDEVYKAIADLGNTVGDVTGTPVHGVTALVKGVKDVATGNTNFPVQRILGYSEKAVEGGKGFFDSSESEDQVTKLINDTKNPSLKKILDMNKPLPAPAKKPLPGSKSKPLPTQKVKPLPKN